MPVLAQEWSLCSLTFRQCCHAGIAGMQAFRRMRSEDTLQSGSKGFRATSLPAGDAVYGPRSGGLGRHPGGHSFPLTQPPPDVNSHPNEFQARHSVESIH